MLKFFDAAEVGGENAAYGSLISCAVRVASDVAINGADVQAGTAADTVQDFALFWIGEQIGASVVEQDDMEFFGAIDLSGLAGAANECLVGG